jgi:hypothetical protein
MIENSMVMDRLWREEEPTVICECVGCQEDILEGDQVLEFTDIDGETILLHQDSECTYQYVASMAVCKDAGE